MYKDPTIRMSCHIKVQGQEKRQTSQKPTQMRNRMRQIIRLVKVVEGDVDSAIVFARCDFYSRAGEVGTELVEPAT